MTQPTLDHESLHELSRDELAVVHGGFFFLGGCVPKLPTEDMMDIVSCHNGSCGVYPAGTRTDEAR